MKKTIILDTTLSHTSELAGNVPFRNLVETVRLLDVAGVDVIEFPEFTGDKTAEILMKSAAAVTQTATLSVRVPLAEPTLAEACREALQKAPAFRLSVAAPISAAQMEYRFHKKPEKLIAMISAAVAHCRTQCAKVEFAAQDVFGGEFDVLKAELEAAIAAGATEITLCEPTGTRLPSEVADLVTRVRSEVAGAAEVSLFVDCSDACRFAMASAMAALEAGADGVKTSVTAGAVPLADLCEVARLRGDALGFSIGLNVMVLKKTANKISWMLGESKDAPDKAAPLTAREPKEKLSDKTDIETVKKQTERLGYALSHEDLAKVYEEIRRISAKKEIGDKELEAIIATTALQVPPAYRLVSYLINCGNVIPSLAHVRLEKDGRTLDGVCQGDGPIDAAFKAVEQIIGHHYELDDFQIQSVTEGREAVGSALVKLRSEGRLCSGQGVSTDIIGASLRAYISALNKIIYEEE